MKKVAIMQPYFFPYIGYFSLIKNVDEFILFDTPQFMRHGWIERNRILKQNEGWIYIKVPLLKHAQEDIIKNIKINQAEDWRETIRAQLGVYKRIAPYYEAVVHLVEDVLGVETDSIVELNKEALEGVCRYLGIETPIKIFSEMELVLGDVGAPDEWALEICKSIGAKEYWNPPGGKSFFDKSKYDAVGIKLCFHEVGLAEYDQKRQPFETGLSIVDVLMFNSIETVNKMLDNYELR